MGETVYRFLAHPKQVQTTIFNAQGDYRRDLVKENARCLADAIKGSSARFPRRLLLGNGTIVQAENARHPHGSGVQPAKAKTA